MLRTIIPGIAYEVRIYYHITLYVVPTREELITFDGTFRLVETNGRT